MVHTVICKLSCQHVSPIDANLPADQQHRHVRLQAVFAGRSELQALSENAIFGHWTPSASLDMSIANPSAVDLFEVGEEYYVEIRKAPKVLNAEQITWLEKRIAEMKASDIPHERAERQQLERLMLDAAAAVTTAA